MSGPRFRDAPGGVRFGQVWEGRPEIIGPIRYLVVSSEAYNAAFGDRRVIAVEVDPSGVYEGGYREPIVDAGTAHLDRLTWIARRHLVEVVAELHPSRYEVVSTTIRELVGTD